MKDYTFSSIFASEMHAFLELRASQGLRDYTKLYILESLDKYLIGILLAEKVLVPSIIDAWLAESSAKMHVNTINNFINFYAPFARYLNALGFAAFIPERPIPQRTYVPYIFSEQEIETMFRVADEMNGRINGRLSRLQFPMVLRLLYGCGLRLGEALRLRLDDFDMANSVLFVSNAKGNIDRLVPMELGLGELLAAYCEALFHDRSDNPFLFEGEGKAPRTQGWVKWYWDRLLEEAGIYVPQLPKHSRNICPHCMRHTFAVNSLRMNDADGIDGIDSTPLLSVYLGHRHLTGTQAYLHMTAENAEDIFMTTRSLSKEMFPEVPQT
jgi:integrase